MFNFLLVVQILVSVAIISLVMLQQGKGADMGAAFGSGSSGTVFGARGSANFMSRATAICATVFFLASLSLAYVVQGTKAPESVVDKVGVPAEGTPAVVSQEPAKEAGTPKVPE